MQCLLHLIRQNQLPYRLRLFELVELWHGSDGFELARQSRKYLRSLVMLLLCLSPFGTYVSHCAHCIAKCRLVEELLNRILLLYRLFPNLH